MLAKAFNGFFNSNPTNGKGMKEMSRFYKYPTAQH